MSIVFFCQSCGARFEVADRLAGKTGHCKKCGQQMTIPRAEALASMMAMKAVPAAALALAEAPAAGPAGGPPAPHVPMPGMPWAPALPSQIGLAPLTISAMPRGARPGAKATPLDDGDTGSALYRMISMVGAAPVRLGTGKSAGAVTRLWRRELGGIQKLLRWIGDTAYLLSVPFIILILVGAATRNRPLAITGAAVVVALNVGRLASGLINLAVIHFRDSPVKGVLFLIPPLTVYYLAVGWKRMQKAIRRVVEPAATIGIVILAFLFIPSLRHGGPAGGKVSVDQVRAEAEALGKDLQGEAVKARNLDVNKLGETAKGKLNELQKQFHDEGKAAPSGTGKPTQSTTEGKLKGFTDQIRKYADDVQKQN